MAGQPNPNDKPDAIINALYFAASFFWGILVAALMYANNVFLFATIVIYLCIFIVSRSAQVKHGAAWSIFGVTFWYAYIWCVMLGGEFH